MPHQTTNQTPGQLVTSSQLRRRTWLGQLVWLVLLIIILAAFWQRQAISDWVKLYHYQPPTQVAMLGHETTMTATAQHLFYINKPQIDDKAEFANHCKEQEQTIVLGCYHSGESGIYILKIADDSELHGVMQVTAAHEMLHAAYERLSSAERTTIDRQLQQFYKTGLKDAAIKAEINSYRKTEPNDVVNEMHSIFGTEVAKLPTGLEQYYSRYFSDRQAIVKQSERYRQAFTQRETAVKRDDTQLQQLQQQIKDHEAALQTQSADLSRGRASLEAYRTSGDISRYNAAVPGFNAKVQTFNQLLATTKDEIDSYNNIVVKRNALVVEVQNLAQQLSGNSLPAAQ